MKPDVSIIPSWMVYFGWGIVVVVVCVLIGIVCVGIVKTRGK